MENPKQKAVVTLNILIWGLAIIAIIYGLIALYLETGMHNDYWLFTGLLSSWAILITITCAKTIDAIRFPPSETPYTVLTLNGMLFTIGLFHGIDTFGKSQANPGEVFALIISGTAFINLIVLIFTKNIISAPYSNSTSQEGT